MTALEEFKNSTAWSDKYNLPVVPIHSNPWIYCAYAKKIIEHNGEQLREADIYEFMLGCFDSEIGLFHRWPTKAGGMFSHDEIIGLFILDHAGWGRDVIFGHLESNFGIYNNTGETHWNPLRYCVYRFHWLRPFLIQAIDQTRPIGLINQSLWSSLLIPDLLREPNDWGGMLRKWAMLDIMSRSPICRFFINKWKKRLESKGISPKVCFEHYLAECPVFRKLAPDKF